MDRSRAIVFASLCAAAALFSGCRGGYETDVLERELRHQEDRIYAMQDAIEEYQARLDATRRENDALRRELGLDASSAEPPTSGGRPAGVVPPVVIPPVGPIEIDPGVPLDQLNLRFPSSVLPDEESPPAEPPGMFTRDDEPLSSAPVSQIVFNRMLTGGLNTDGRPGDEGLMLVDPSRGEPTHHVARWDFSNEEAQLAWKRTLLGRGMHFEIVWPGDPPPGGTYELWARLLTPGGEKHLTRTTIRIDPSPGVGASRSESPDGFISRQADASGWSQRIAPPDEPAAVATPNLRSPNRPTPIAPAAPSAGRASPTSDGSLVSPAPRGVAPPWGETPSVRAADASGLPAWQPFR
jgi:hypothetical protein